MSNSHTVLVAYFSCTGMTRAAARAVAEATGGELFAIRPAVPYTEADLDWLDRASRSSLEMSDPASRPLMAERPRALPGADVVFLGYPIWWYEAPRILCTFLESGDFAGKTIVPFCTSGGSSVGASAQHLHRCCGEGTVWLPGKRLRSIPSPAELSCWLQSLAL